MSQEVLPSNYTEEDDDVILTIDTFAKPKKYLKINGERIAMLSFSDFGVREKAFLMRVGRKLDKLTKQDISEAEADQISKEMHQYVGKICPDMETNFRGLLAKLTDNDCEQVIRRFLDSMPKDSKEETKELPDPEKERMQKFVDEQFNQAPSTSASSFPGYNGSTAM